MKKLLTTIPILISLFLTVNAQETSWQSAAPGVWLLKVGQEQSITLLDSWYECFQRSVLLLHQRSCLGVYDEITISNKISNIELT